MNAAALLALDPGPEHSALVRWDGAAISIKQYSDNAEILSLLRDRSNQAEPLVIEQVVSYGMAVGQTVFETCVWTGRFMEAYGAEHVRRIPRIDVKMHLCHNSRAKDGNLRQAILDRFGGKDKAIGKKARPGPLYGISGDLWAALALAITAGDVRIITEEEKRS